MNRLLLRKLQVCLVWASLVGCGGENDRGSERVGEIIEPLVGSDWIGYELGVSPGTWRYKGKMKFAPDATSDEPRGGSPAPQKPFVPVEHSNAWDVNDPVSGNVYQVEVDEADLRVLGEALTAAGWADGYAPPDTVFGEEAESPDVPKSWGNGTDNRVNYHITSTYPATFWPFRAIAQIRNPNSSSSPGHCGATFIGNQTGPMYVLTAAHCLYDRVTGGYLANHRYWPRADSCRDPANNNEIIPGCDPSPFGHWVPGWSRVPSNWSNNACAQRPVDPPWECYTQDIALVRVFPASGATNPGGMAFGYYDSTYLDQFPKYHRGYPNCNYPDAPQPVCQTNTLYGSGGFSKSSGSFLDGGYPLYYDTSTDVSPGHSGGPAYVKFGSGLADHVLFGVVNQSRCVGAACAAEPINPYVTGVRAITYNYYHNILYQMSLHDGDLPP